MAEFAKAVKVAESAEELDAAVQPALDRNGLILFFELDHGMIVRKGNSAPQCENHSSRGQESSHHEGNRKARSGRRLVCPG